jgi:hypothetical protein
MGARLKAKQLERQKWWSDLGHWLQSGEMWPRSLGGRMDRTR